MEPREGRFDSRLRQEPRADAVEVVARGGPLHGGQRREGRGEEREEDEDAEDDDEGHPAPGPIHHEDTKHTKNP